MWRRRTAFITVFLASGIALASTGQDIYLAIVTILFLILAFSAIDIVHAAVSVKIEQFALPEYPVKGDTATIQIDVKNRGIIPISFMMVWYSTPYSEARGAVPISVMPRRREIVQIEFPCKYRGMYVVGASKLEIRDIFGLFCVRLKSRKLSSIDFTVYPRVVELASRELPQTKLEGRSGAPFSHMEDQFSVSDIRRWNPGDTVRRVHWKLTFRYMELLVREFENVGKIEAAVLVDASDSGRDLETQDAVIECAVSVCASLLSGGAAVRLSISGISELTASGTGEFIRLYNALAALEFGGVNALENANLSGAEKVVAILPRVDKNMADMLEMLVGEGKSVTAVVVSEGGEKMPAGVSAIFLTPPQDISAASGGYLP